jgi:Xaa-Pro aminopeptidase
MITQEEYAQRRKKLLDNLDENCVVFIRSNDIHQRNNDCDFRFRQHSDFYYLTGLSEPHALCVLIKDESDYAYHLFLRPNNFNEELWDGKRPGLEGAKEQFGANESYDITTFIEALPYYLRGREKIYYLVGEDTFLDANIPKALLTLQHQIRRGVKAPECIENIAHHLGEMRLIKSDAEINLMRKVCGISAEAFNQVMVEAKQASNEYELHARLLYDFHRQGCQTTAYDPIVGSGKNACILHYVENNQPINRNDLILIDAGGELDNYAADITRTFPASGKFSNEQRAIYELVLKSQLEAIELIKPGRCWADLQKRIIEILTAGLCELDIIKEDVKTAIANETYKHFYMHNSGHWLGLDVHDVGSYTVDGQWRDLQAGMILTVEPGIYIADCHQNVDTKWHNIGVRIEDDVLVTKNGYEVLTSATPKHTDEIEALMNG